MSYITGDAFYNDALLKYRQYMAYSVTKRDYKLAWWMNRAFGAGKGESAQIPAPQILPAGGRVFEILLTSGYGGSIGGQSSLSLAGFGRTDLKRLPVRFTPSTIHYVTALTEEQYINARAGTDEAYFSEVAEKEKLLIKASAHAEAAALYGTGKYYQITELTADAEAVASASAEYTWTVKNCRAVPEDLDFELRTSAGAVVANAVAGKVMSIASSSGEGTIKVKFPGYSAGFTPLTGMIIVPVNTAASNGDPIICTNGLMEMYGTGIHPRNEFANVQLDHSSYRAIVRDVGSAEPTWDIFADFMGQMKENCNHRGVGSDADSSGYFDERTGKPVANRVALGLNPRVKRNMERIWKNNAQNHLTSPFTQRTIIDEDVSYESFEGVPLLIDVMCPTDQIFYLNMEVIARLSRKEYGPLEGDPNPNRFVRKDGNSTEYILARSKCDTFAPIGRNCLGRITGTNLARVY